MPNLIPSASDSFIPRLRPKFRANMADKVKGDILRLRRLCLSNTILANRERQLIMPMAVYHLLARRRWLLYLRSLIMLLLSQRNAIARVPRRLGSIPSYRFSDSSYRFLPILPILAIPSRQFSLCMSCSIKLWCYG